MKHPSAARWDRDHGKDPACHAAGTDPRVRPCRLPVRRPCDWCGQPVERGWIHPACIEAERRLALELFW